MPYETAVLEYSVGKTQYVFEIAIRYNETENGREYSSTDIVLLEGTEYSPESTDNVFPDSRFTQKWKDKVHTSMQFPDFTQDHECTEAHNGCCAVCGKLMDEQQALASGFTPLQILKKKAEAEGLE